MKTIFCILLSIFWSNLLMANTNVDQALYNYAWEKRQLIVFTPSEDHKEYSKLKTALKNFEEHVEDRKLHTWNIINDDVVFLNDLKTNDITNEEFRSKFKVNINDFMVILIGYDQGVKLKQTETDLQTIFYTIDQMPMRIQELSNQ